MKRIVHNTTFHVDRQISPLWLHAMQQIFLPRLTELEMSTDILFTRVLLEQEEEHDSFSLQVVFDNRENHQRYLEMHRGAFHNALFLRFPNRFVSFSTTLEEVEDAPRTETEEPWKN